MFDHSLHTLPNRLAADGEELVVHRFGDGSLGLASPSDIGPIIQGAGSHNFWSRAGVKQWFQGYNPLRGAHDRIPAVCISPGARLLLRDIPKGLQRELGVGDSEDVEFVQTSAEANVYRDAVRFKNCRRLLLQELRQGQRVRVISTSSVAEPEPLDANWIAV